MLEYSDARKLFATPKWSSSGQWSPSSPDTWAWQLPLGASKPSNLAFHLGWMPSGRGGPLFGELLSHFGGGSLHGLC